jgi:hypothetical protein
LLAPTVVRLSASEAPAATLERHAAPPAPPDEAARLQQDFVSSVVLPGASAATANAAPQQLLPDRPLAEIPRLSEATWTAHNRFLPALNETRPSDAQQVIAVLTKYSQAWSEKDLADIRALRPSLERRTVKQAMAGARSISMQIRPTGAPKIEGDHATVECIHRVAQVFDDGTERQSPDVHMTYVLVKHGASWLIADSR